MHGIRIICILAIKDDLLNHLLREYDCLNEGPAKRVVRFQMQPIGRRDFACEARPRQPRQFLPAATPFRPMRRLGGEAQGTAEAPARTASAPEIRGPPPAVRANCARGQARPWRGAFRRRKARATPGVAPATNAAEAVPRRLGRLGSR
jgi:hypothetical protein